ncbi:UvrB/UvrC motif-containing protein [Polymorphobacter multimanifer]|uniref:UVR domain-containing protein n=1 Tax=Polymorphobacter multimanifer TaxID=1070431 RepID=A0A841L2S2_9SPHN|nr:UvrB/UvrC motif-containing protein [Polymorphobacter multimanifer]MBB6226957.1 hypothetical protein [Polymorphobacter multimanifer]
MATTRQRLEAEMHAAAAAGEFERAAKLRDELRALDFDPSEIHAQVPGAMGIGTQHPKPVRPEGWKPPKKPDPMTKGRKR